MKKKGIIVVYIERIGVIKYDGREYCSFSSSNLKRNNIRKPAKGCKVEFKLKVKRQPLRFEATEVKIVTK